MISPFSADTKLARPPLALLDWCPHIKRVAVNRSRTVTPAALAMPTTPIGYTMNARFLREEAARFRDMAAATDREASRVRFLAMAADFEARAAIAQDAVQPPEDAPTDAPPDDETTAPPEPARTDVLKLKPSRRGARTTKTTVTAGLP